MLTVNGLTAHDMRWHAGWSGAWVADLDYAGEISPSGKVAIVSTEGIFASGTVDEKRSGTFGEKRQLRVVGGLGWGQDVRAQHYHADIGVNLAVLVTTTAAEVAEVATVLLPKQIGPDFVRRNGPAGQIFTDAGVDWWVGLDGVTRVGLRVPAPPHPSLQILDWHPAEATVTFTCEVLVEPGTIVVDLRFGSKIVREVDAKVSQGSVSGTLWLADAPPGIGESVNELVDALGKLAREASRADFARFYEYVVIAMAGDRAELQSLSRSDGMPDILPCSVWAGTSGYRAMLAPGSRVLVGFRGGDPKRPFVAFYEAPEGGNWRPVTYEIDAVGSVTIGASALGVVIGNVMSAQPIARAPAIAAFATALATAVAATAATATATGVTPVTGATLGGWLGALASAIASAASTLATACPSTKALSS